MFASTFIMIDVLKIVIFIILNINLIYSYLKSPSFSSYLYYLALNNPNKLHITISLIFASMKVKIYKLLETKLRYQVI